MSRVPRFGVIMQFRHCHAQQYTRFAFSSRKAEKNCRVYTSADEAQTDFLKMGGPQKDKRGIDPDGDGYACGWSPAVYRSLIGH